MSQKAKMCKSPKNIVYAQSDRIEYENLNTNCTIVGSNNLHLVKKPQIVTSMSPAYSNPSPGYPPSPYSSPASLKSPSPQLNMKPPTPQPNTFPVMQIIHNSHPVIARPIHASQQQNVIKLKPPLNILPKPSASPQQSPKPSVSPQIVLPANQQATIMPTAQPLLLNQMPMLAPGVQFILRPQTAKLPQQVQQTPQGLILQQGGQQLLQIQPPRSQPMVRVLANGMGMPTTTYVTHMTPQNNIQQSAPPPQSTPPKKKPNKKKKQKLDLANIMKLSGIGDDDDVQFESDASQSESEHNAHSQPVTPQPTTPTIMQQPTPPLGNLVQTDKSGAKLGNIQISAVPQAINAAGTPLMQVLNQSFQGGAQNQQGQPTSIPFNPFVTPNFTINNGLMVQRSGGFKLALGEDGRLVLQHDPTLNQDLQSQLLLQSIFGLNGQLVLQPSIDQQIHSQTVQTIQQQSVQTIQQQTVQSQTIQTVQHQIVQPQALQSIQSQIQGQIQSMLQQQNLGSQSIAIQPQNITIQPQGIQGLQVSQPLSIQSQALGIQSQAQPLTIQSHSQPVTIQTQSLPLTIQSHTPHHNQIINLSQANQIFASNNLQQQPQMQLQQRTTQPQQQQVLPQPASTQTQTSMIQQPHNFTHSSTPNQTVSLSSQPTMGTQPVLKVQPFQKSQPPVQTVHPIHHTHHTTHHHHHQQQQQQQQPQQPPPTSYVVNLTPDQLEQLKRNGQLTVNGQTIFMQRPNKTDEKKTSPKIKPIKKVSKIPTVVKENRAVNNLEKTINNVVKESVKAIHLPNHKQVSVQTQASAPKTQPAAIIQPQPAKVVQATKIHVQPTVVVQPAPPPPPPTIVEPQQPTATPEVERFMGQLMDETPPQPVPPVTTTTTTVATPNIVINTAAPMPQPQPAQRVHTIQLTPQKQQHLKSIQLQIQTLSARLTPGNTEMQNALKLLFQEQQKILATGKLLPPDKVFYHNNQLIVNSGVAGLVKNSEVVAPQPVKPPAAVVVAAAVVTTAANGPVAEKFTTTTANSIQPSVVPIAPAPPKLVVTAAVAPTEVAVAPVQKIAPVVSVVAPSQPPQQQTRFIPMYTKAQLIEQQLNTDQNGAVKPDIHAGFKDKADACKRLIRYHCFEQPVLSQKDLDKADEIFELTARHFIDKFGRMADKYRFLLHKESQRHVQTSELMMLDRMFLAEEQQSLIRLRQEIDECNMEMQQQNSMQTGDSASEPPPMNSEEYDEWACIQRELGCLPLSEEGKMSATTTTTTTVSASSSSPVSTPSVKRSSSADSRLETLKKFRVEKHCKKNETDFVVKPGRNQNVHCTTVLSSSSVVHGTTTNIQSNYQERTMQHNSSIGRTIVSSSNGTSCSIANRINRATNHVAPMEPLGSSTPIQSGSGNPLHNIHNSLHSYNSMQLQNPIQRLHGMPSVHQNFHPLQHVVHNSTQQALLQRNVQHYSTQHIVQHITHTVHHTQQMHGGSTQNSVHHSSSVHSSQNSYSSGNEELDNNDSIDEQVQSAIDSILNLQQNTSLELDETMQNMLS